MNSTALAQSMWVTEQQITATTNEYATTPTLGTDGVGDVVVYTQQTVSSTTGLLNGTILAQRPDADGSATGSVITVSDDPA